jgi:hypothetical protein
LTTIKGAMKVMAWTKAKMAIVVGITSLLIAGTATVTIEKMAKPSLKVWLVQSANNPDYKLTLEAARFVANLKYEGLLPGFSKSDKLIKVMIEALVEDTNGVWRPTTNVPDSFPASRTVWAAKNNDSRLTYFYTVTKMSETDRWHLQKAWRDYSNYTNVYNPANMPQNLPNKSHSHAFTLVKSAAIAIRDLTTVSTFAKTPSIILGPLNPGAEHGSDNWYYGSNAAAFLSVDDTDPATGTNDFTLGNNTPGQENSANWRSQNFPLGLAADNGGPITFSFVYKLTDEVKADENLSVYLRFFDATGTHYLNERSISIGSSSGDSNMTHYKRVTLTNIHAQQGAKTADIWVTANIFKPWTSGTARFDDFSVATVPREHPMRMSVKILLGLGIVLAAWAIWRVWFARLRRTES